MQPKHANRRGFTVSLQRRVLCDFTGITIGMSVADLIARCGLAPSSRNPLADSAQRGAQAPARGETWVYPADASRAAREIRLQEGRVTDIEVLH